MMRFIILLVIAGAVGALNFHWLRTPIETNPLEVSQQGTPHGLTSELKTARATETRSFSVSDISHTYTRPLFEESRRKWQPEKKEIKPAKPVDLNESEPIVTIEKELLRITLKGIAILPENKTALIEDHKSDTVKWLKASSYVQGWQIEEITPAGVIFTRADERIEVNLHKLDPFPDG